MGLGWGCRDLEVSRSNIFVGLGLCHGERNVCDHAWGNYLCSVPFVAHAHIFSCFIGVAYVGWITGNYYVSGVPTFLLVACSYDGPTFG